ncbi:MAG: 50S ribosomal protein L11, partial [Candidatus ainarchaeum sp.]|nr:50S ribosomal protein L11 [Candidatus ainarchaeum sp.]
AKINEKTADLDGMQVPVTISINADKSFDIQVGLPPTSALICKEASAAKGSGSPKATMVGNLTVEQVKKVAQTKYDVLNSKDMKNAVKEIMGTCNSMGITVEGVKGKAAIKMLNEGKFDSRL